jgi:hypothetical protein
MSLVPANYEFKGTKVIGHVDMASFFMPTGAKKSEDSALFCRF